GVGRRAQDTAKVEPQRLRGAEADGTRDLLDAESRVFELTLGLEHAPVVQPAMRRASELGLEAADECAWRERRRPRDIVAAARTKTPEQIETIRAPRPCALRSADSSRRGGVSAGSRHPGTMIVSAAASVPSPRRTPRWIVPVARSGPGSMEQTSNSYHGTFSSGLGSPNTSTAMASSNSATRSYATTTTRLGRRRRRDG